MRDLNSLEDFLQLLDEELALDYAPQDAARDLTALPGWDSLHLLRLVVALETTTGRRLRVRDAIEAASLQELYAVVEAAR
jgi:acyl carrier protein